MESYILFSSKYYEYIVLGWQTLIKFVAYKRLYCAYEVQDVPSRIEEDLQDHLSRSIKNHATKILIQPISCPKF